VKCSEEKRENMLNFFRSSAPVISNKTRNKNITISVNNRADCLMQTPTADEHNDMFLLVNKALSLAGFHPQKKRPTVRDNVSFVRRENV